MKVNRLIELEFSTNTSVVEAANRVVSRLGDQLGEMGLRVEPLIRLNNKLVAPWGEGAEQAQAYAYRIHVRPIERSEWRAIRARLLTPLASQGVSIRESRIAA
jgi:hypothetical protein